MRPTASSLDYVDLTDIYTDAAVGLARQINARLFRYVESLDDDEPPVEPFPYEAFNAMYAVIRANQPEREHAYNWGLDEDEIDAWLDAIEQRISDLPPPTLGEQLQLPMMEGEFCCTSDMMHAP